MTDTQQPPDTGGQPFGPGWPLPPGQDVITVAGPWTVLSCVTAASTGCGAAPADEDTGMTPHFASTSQAAQELAQNWGWTWGRRSDWPKDDVLLCPKCAAAPARPSRRPTVSCPSAHDLAQARARVSAVTEWIAATEDGIPPGQSAIDAAVGILAAPPPQRNASASVHPATVYRVGGHLVAVYRFGSRIGPVAAAECSCPDNGVCEHLLVALAYELPPISSGRRTP